MKWGVFMTINFNRVKAKHYKCACHCCCDKEKAKQLLDKAVEKAKNSVSIYETREKLYLFFGIIKDWIKGNYQKIPTGSLVVIFIALLYFVSPIDIVPDFLPAGLVDDAFIISLVAKQISSDLEKYRNWKLKTKPV